VFDVSKDDHDGYDLGGDARGDGDDGGDVLRSGIARRRDVREREQHDVAASASVHVLHML
jgi:hypothetical protein